MGDLWPHQLYCLFGSDPRHRSAVLVSNVYPMILCLLILIVSSIKTSEYCWIEQLVGAL